MYIFTKSVTRSDFNEARHMPFLIKDDRLLEKYDEI